jgi:hypothetical protein
MMARPGFNGWPPMFDYRVFPNDEMASGRSIHTNLMRLKSYVDNFEAAVDLFETCAGHIRDALKQKTTTPLKSFLHGR